MSDRVCWLCHNELAEDPGDEGFWAIAVEDPANPEAGRAHPVHTNCIKSHYPEEFDLMCRRLERIAL